MWKWTKSSPNGQYFHSKLQFPDEHNNTTQGGLADLQMQHTTENLNADV